MHYGNGEEARVGDLAVFMENDEQVAGLVSKLLPSCGSTCNLQIMPLAQRTGTDGSWFPIVGQSGWYKTASSGFPLVPKEGQQATG